MQASSQSRASRAPVPDLNPRTRSYGADERLADLLVHVISTIGAAAGALTLVIVAGWRGWLGVTPIGVYGAALVLTFAASAAYNLGYDTRFRAFLRRLDHSAIFLMIAGTYTPFTVLLIHGPIAFGSTLAIWATAAGGIALKLLHPRLFEKVGVAIYLALGWAALVIYAPMASSLSASALGLLVAGGALYSIGVCFHLRERMRFHNAIWHCFVLAAAACHFTSVLTGVALR